MMRKTHLGGFGLPITDIQRQDRKYFGNIDYIVNVLVIEPSGPY